MTRLGPFEPDADKRQDWLDEAMDRQTYGYDLDPPEPVHWPMLPKSPDGVYSRCVWCQAEIYYPAVMLYSQGGSFCHICHRALPPSYIQQ